MQRAPHLWTAGQEGLDINVGVVHFETVVPESSGDPDGRQHAGLKEEETRFKNSKTGGVRSVASSSRQHLQPQLLLVSRTEGIRKRPNVGYQTATEQRAFFFTDHCRWI